VRTLQYIPKGAFTDGNSYDYTKGKLGVLVDIIIESGAKLFGKIWQCQNNGYRLPRP
jgi:hypothetical protein